MDDEFDALPTWIFEFTKKCGIAQPVHSLEALTDALLTHFECRADQPGPEDAKALSLLISACAHSLTSPDSALKFLNDQHILDQAGWLAEHWTKESGVLYSQPQIDDLYLLESDEPPCASLWTLTKP